MKKEAEEKKYPFDLKLRISPSEKNFRERIGPEAFAKLKAETFQKNGYICQGCEYDGNVNHASIDFHLVEINEDEPLESKFATLCKACHLTQHVDVAVEKEMVNIVNSTFTQAKIIEITQCKGNGISEINTRILKTPAIEIIEKIRNGTISKQTKIKIVFTVNFKF